MLILYGSYARGNYVDYDQRTEFGVRTYFMSDYDMMVVLKTYRSVTRTLERVEERYRDHRHPTTVTPIQFITETIGNLNKAIDKGHYFYTDIKKEGIMLYDSGRYQLAESRKLNFAEIKAWAEEYFKERFGRANSFLRDAKYA